MNIPEKIRNSSRALPQIRLAAIAALICTGPMTAQATTYYWDPDYSTTGLQYGSGTWVSGGTVSVSSFATGTAGTTRTTWVNSSSSVMSFDSSTSGGASGLITVTLGENITAGSVNEGWNYSRNLVITDGGSAYTLTTGTISDNNSSYVLTIDCVVAGTNLTKSSGGYVILTKNCTYSGSTTITGITSSSAGGTLQVGEGGTTGALGAGDVYFVRAGTQAGASTLSLVHSSAVTVSNNIHFDDTINGGIISNYGKSRTNTALYSGGKVTLTGTQYLTGTLANQVTYDITTINNASPSTSSVDAEISGKITGTGGITKIGKGTLLVSGTANDFSGGTTVKEGCLVVNGNLGSGAVNVLWDGSNTYAALAGSGTIAGVVTGSNATINGSGLTMATITLGGTSVLSGNNIATSVTVAGGTTTLSGTTTSAFNISSGATLVGSGYANGAVSATSAAINGSGLRLGATTLYGTSTLSGYNIASSLTVAGGTTTLTGTTKSTSTLSVALGAGLTANGTIDGSAAVSGLLTGTSTIKGNLSLTSGTLSPGNSAGITTVSGNFTMDSNSKLISEVSGSVAGTSYDQVKVSGNVSLAGTLDLSALSGLTLGETITLIENTGSGTTTGYFSTIITSGSTYTVTSGSTYTFYVGTTEYEINYAANTDLGSVANDVTLTVVPEPGTWAMVVAGIGMLGFAQRLVRRKSGLNPITIS
ncbi:MAG: autotransporter-associated beta strand repeat-containing protein [Chthoniobacteraceae bacterium]